MESDSEKWLAYGGEEFLREIGIKEKKNILDFGCGDGAYAIPAAKAVGGKGRVYVADKDGNAIEALLNEAESRGLDNIFQIPASQRLNLDNNSIDAALLYDVLHYMDENERRNLYGEIHRVLKTGGILSVYPKHNKSDWPMWNLSDMDIEDIIKEIENSGFHLERKYCKRLMHNGRNEIGTVLNFRKISFTVAFSTDDRKNLNDSHFGSAKFFHIYEFGNGKAEFVEERENIKIEEDESIKGGDPEKANATAGALKGVDVLAGRRFGPNITRMLNRFACVIVKTDSVENAVNIVQGNMNRIMEEMSKGKDRKHIILREQI